MCAARWRGLGGFARAADEKTATRAVFHGSNRVTSLTPALVTTVRAASFPT